MTRVALYARYSTDKQSEASIEDQLRLCHERAAREGWTVVGNYTDAALSGATLKQRPGIQRMMQDAAANRFDIVLAESLDRLSRDQEHTAGLHKRLTFFRVRIVTLNDAGDINEMHVGLKSTMSAMLLKDGRDKTRRGMAGLIEKGRSAGGSCYGYRVVPGLKGDRGKREIAEAEKAIVLRIFRAFVAGVSPKAIAKGLNAEGIVGPRSRPWSPSTIHGHVSRGTGILNNELYIGRLIWDRQRFTRHPDTGNRVPRLNPSSQWRVKEVPELRIVDDALWQAVKARQASTKSTMKTGIVGGRRPKYLFSGLTTCAVCGGGFMLSSHDLLTCFNRHSRGTCTNRRSIKRQEVEARVLRAMRERLLEPGAFAAFCEGFTAELEARRREHIAQMAGARRELAGVERRQKEILNALAEGYRSEAWKAELVALDARRAGLGASLAEPALPALHPQMAQLFHRKVMTLAAGLQDDTQRDVARQALRGFLEKIVIPPGDGLLQVVGNFGEMLAAGSGRGRSCATAVGYVGCGGGI